KEKLSLLCEGVTRVSLRNITKLVNVTLYNMSANVDILYWHHDQNLPE
ncbi:unnamed protein product, partial [marine sediment metagenome]